MARPFGSVLLSDRVGLIRHRHFYVGQIRDKKSPYLHKGFFVFGGSGDSRIKNINY